MHCPLCNTLNRDDAKFCKGCGQSLHPSQAAPAEAMAEAINHVPTQETQVATAGQAASTDAAQEPAPLEASASEVSRPEEDPTLAPTLILTPEKMVAYHQRRWQEARAAQDTPEADASSESNFDAPAVSSAPAQIGSPVEPEQARNAIDLPAPITQSQDEHDAIPIPPPPPPSAESLAEGETKAAPGEAENNAGYVENAGYPEMEKVETMQDSSEHASSEQAEPSTPEGAINQVPAASGDFALLALGTTLQGRYEISQVIADNPQEHVYQVIDHQGYQRCWNCNSEHNAEGDDFCIDCGASLLDIPYNMHEYSAVQNQEDTPVLQGNIVNTFVDQGRTYVIEQIPAEQSVFPNGVHLLAATSSDAGNVRRSDPNEDSSLVLQIQRIHESISSPVGVYIIADGMGGHDNGQLASHMTINVIAERMTRELLLAPLIAEKEGAPAKPFDEEGLMALLHDTIEDANSALCQVNTRDKTDMGSTLTGFMIVGEHA